MASGRVEITNWSSDWVPTAHVWTFNAFYERPAFAHHQKYTSPIFVVHLPSIVAANWVEAFGEGGWCVRCRPEANSDGRWKMAAIGNPSKDRSRDRIDSIQSPSSSSASLAIKKWNWSGCSTEVITHKPACWVERWLIISLNWSDAMIWYLPLIWLQSGRMSRANKLLVGENPHSLNLSTWCWSR